MTDKGKLMYELESPMVWCHKCEGPLPTMYRFYENVLETECLDCGDADEYPGGPAGKVQGGEGEVKGKRKAKCVEPD